jgi:alanine racemase
MQTIHQIYLQLKDKQIVTDSRSLVAVPKESVFFAFKGAHANGGKFVREMYEKGVRNFVGMDSSDYLDVSPNSHFFQVENTLATLQDLAAHHRTQFPHLEVIGITGSNGKTIVKEWLAQLLQAKYALIKSPKSYNSQLGVPLSVWQIKSHHQIGIFEAGISKPNEMSTLEKIIQPTIGIFTNIGTAHDEGFENKKQKIKEKLQLFKNCKILIYCADYTEITEIINEEINNCNFAVKTLTWGRNVRDADIQTLDNLPFTDFASVENCMHCVATMLHLGYELSEIQQLIGQQFSTRNNALPMRLELKKGINQCVLIDDTYTNDLQALSIALDFMNQHAKNNFQKKTVILSDILHTNIPSQEIYTQILNLLISNQINKFIGIGKDILTLLEVDRDCAIEKYFYPDTEAFIQDFLQEKISFQHEQILVKGARKFQFDRITGYLQEKVHGTRLEINLDALVHNLKFYKSLLKPQTKIMVMVKAFAYGSGIVEVANILQYQNVDYLAVAYADEGAHLRKHGIRLPIMVMNPAEETFDKLIQHDLEPEIYSFRILNQFIHHCTLWKEKREVKIHLKIDTGMRRLGFETFDIEALSYILGQNTFLKIASIFTHLAGADDEKHNDFSLAQISAFQSVAHQLGKSLNYPILKHALNSAGITRWTDYQLDMVRLGIGLYGVEANGTGQSNLQNVTTLKTSISQIKYLAKGETVGYGRRWTATRDSKIGTIAIGYADGYDRRFSNGLGKISIKNQLAPIIGSVCMDMSMVDLTGIDAREGDEVIVFGKEVSIVALAKAINTIPYEIFTGIGERVKRVFFTE